MNLFVYMEWDVEYEFLVSKWGVDVRQYTWDEYYENSMIGRPVHKLSIFPTSHRMGLPMK